MNQNEKEITKELQKVELELLKEFIRVCDELELNYFLIGGTLIGAVRHGGFIPWDDDIDVCMMREDYEKFILQAPNYLKSNYFLQTYLSDENYSNCFAKIRNSSTTFIELPVKDVDMNHGIYIDIFPLDNYHIYNKIKVKLIHYTLYKQIFKKRKNLLKRFLAYLGNAIYGKYSKQELCKKLDLIYTSANEKDKEVVVNFCGSWGVKKESHRKVDYSDYKLLNFEGIKVKVPIGYDRILTDTYGDYMQLPPEEKRVTHHFTQIIDTKKSYLYYKNGENR